LYKKNAKSGVPHLDESDFLVGPRVDLVPVKVRLVCRCEEVADILDVIAAMGWAELLRHQSQTLRQIHLEHRPIRFHRIGA
jgi:hypothetical protein